MSVLWVAPLVIFAAGALLLTNFLRESAREAESLRAACARLDDLRVALVALRADGDATREKAQALRGATKLHRDDR